MGLLDNFVKSSIDGVVIELDKGNTPYVAGEKVMIVMNKLCGRGQLLFKLLYNSFFLIECFILRLLVLSTSQHRKMMSKLPR